MFPCLNCGRQRIIHVAVVLLDGTRVPQEIQVSWCKVGVWLMDVNVLGSMPDG